MASIPSAAPPAIAFSTSAEANRPQSPRSALLAALPTLLIGLLLFLPEALHAWGVSGIPTQSNGPASLPWVLFVVIILVGIFVAWRRSWPAWGGAYYFIAWVIPLLFLSYRSGSQSVLLLYPPLLAVLCYRLAVVDRLKFLLAILPALVMIWPVVMEFIQVKVENLEFTLLFCLAALVAYWILRRGSWRLGMWLVLGLNAVVGVSATVIYYLLAEYPGRIAQITPSNFLENLAPLWLAGAAMLLCPLLLAALHALARRSGGAGRVGFWLIFTALLAWMTATFYVYLQGAGSNLPISEASIRSFYQAGSLACGALFLVGASLLIYAALTRSSLPQAWASVLLTLLPAGMPWLFALVVSGPLGGSAFPQPLTYGISFGWVLLSAWLVTYLRIPATASPVYRWGGSIPEKPAAAAG